MGDARTYQTSKPQGHSIAPLLSLILIFLLLAPIVTFSSRTQEIRDHMRIIDRIFSFRETEVRSTPMARLSTARMFHPATMLNDGSILMTGGVDGLQYHPLTSAEVYAVDTARFRVAGSLSVARIFHTATLLDNGTVLIVGGSDDRFNKIRIAELYDPGSGSFRFTGSLKTGRSGHTATVLADGKVLIVGGDDSDGKMVTSVAVSSEVYDRGAFRPTGNLNTARDLHTATLLKSGKVLIVGGLDVSDNAIASAELYDPASGKFIPTGPLSAGRAVHTATLLSDGKVLIAGGHDSEGEAIATAELYDEQTGMFVRTGDLNTARYGASAKALNDGLILIAGGQDNDGNALASMEIYDPATKAFKNAAQMNSRRQNFTTTLLNSGRVLIVGGNSTRLAISSVELYEPSTNSVLGDLSR
jgi:hypothetical protein